MTDADSRPEITLDQAHAMKSAASNLAIEFAGTFGTETIERSCTPPTTSSPAGRRW